MTSAHVVICDDDDVRARDDWAARIRDVPEIAGAVDIEALTGYEVARCLEVLEKRSVAARSIEPTGGVDVQMAVDAAEILVVDYDLTPHPQRPPEPTAEREELVQFELRAQTAETVAYLARCYSTAKYIVTVNQTFKRRTFDLTFQRFADSRADLNINEEDIGSRELWMGTGDGFRPWSWPVLSRAAELFDRRVANVPDLDAPVLESLGLFPIEASGLDSRQLDALGDEPEVTTFRSIAVSPDLGLAGKDQQDDDEALRRIAAAGVGRWLDRMVMPAQNVLVDAPHLAYRFPSLLTGDPAVLASWSQLTSMQEDELGVHIDKIADRRGPACEWFLNPTWSWIAMKDDESIEEVASPWSSESYQWVFCEDISQFRDVSEAREIQTDLPGPYSRRFVAKLDAEVVSYRPNSRLRQ